MGLTGLKMSNFLLVLFVGVVTFQSFSVHSSTTYPQLNGAVRLNKPKLVEGTQLVRDAYQPSKFFKPTKFEVDCQVPYKTAKNSNGKAYFEVVFLVSDGTSVLRKVVSHKHFFHVTLDEKAMAQHLGKTLICQVRTSWSKLGPWSNYYNSSKLTFQFQIKGGRAVVPVYGAVSNAGYDFVLKEDEVRSFQMESTFPITSWPCFDLPAYAFCDSSIFRFSVFVSQSDEDLVKLSGCNFVFRQNKRISNKLELLANRRDTKWKPFPVTLKVKYSGGRIFQGLYPEDIRVQVVQGDTRSVCVSTGDPHLTPFPDLNRKVTYYNFFDPGDYYLLRTTTTNHIGPNVEIQVRQFSCGSWRTASCDCAIFAREGNTIVGLTICDSSTPKAIKYELDNKPSTAVIEYTRNSFKEWKISLLASGIVIDVDILYRFSKQALDLYVYATQNQLNSYTGLCSPDALYNPKSHKVSKTDSFFDLKNQSQTCWEQVVPRPGCSCRDTTNKPFSDSCKLPEYAPSLQIDSTKACRKVRRKRANDYARRNLDAEVPSEIEEGSEKQESTQLPQKDDKQKREEGLTEEGALDAQTRAGENIPETITDRPEEDSGGKQVAEEEGAQKAGEQKESTKRKEENENKETEKPIASRAISKETATKSCTEALRLTPTYDLCSKQVDTKHLIDTCATDTTLMDDDGPVKTAPTEFERACLDSITLSLETPSIAADRAKFDEVNRLKTEVEKLICPSQCNQRGKCVNSKCVCESEYIASDCSLKKDQVPTIKKIVSPVCDIQNSTSDCQTINVEASDVDDQGNVTCQMKSPQGSVGGVPALQTSTTSLSGGLVVCRLPSLPVSRESTDASRVAVYTVQVSISNDGQNFSKELPFNVYDSRCAECTTQPEVSCQPKASGCDKKEEK